MSEFYDHLHLIRPDDDMYIEDQRTTVCGKNQTTMGQFDGWTCDPQLFARYPKACPDCLNHPDFGLILLQYEDFEDREYVS